MANTDHVSPYRADFPVFNHHPTLHYLDSAASAQKPQIVIDAIKTCYESAYAPVHRGLYSLASDASEQYELVRAQVADFINAQETTECIFTRSATEAINMVAQGYARSRLSAGDEIWITEMEHHANFLPWKRVCDQTGATIKAIPLDENGCLDIPELEHGFPSTVKLIALAHISNVLGTVNSIAAITKCARKQSIPVLLDATQSVGHREVDVQQLGCTFMAFSAHKLGGPTGIGVLYGQQYILELVEPLLLGGGMVDRVSDTTIELAALPQKLEAGSPNLAGVVGLGAAITYLQGATLSAIHQHTVTLTHHLQSRLRSINDVTVFGPEQYASEQCSGVVSFNVADIHPHDVAQIAADNHIAVRAGHHCAQPLMKVLGVTSTVRASVYCYNSITDIDALCESIIQAKQLLSVSAIDR